MKNLPSTLGALILMLRNIFLKAQIHVDRDRYGSFSRSSFQTGELPLSLSLSDFHDYSLLFLTGTGINFVPTYLPTYLSVCPSPLNTVRVCARTRRAHTLTATCYMHADPS